MIQRPFAKFSLLPRKRGSIRYPFASIPKRLTSHSPSKLGSAKPDPVQFKRDFEEGLLNDKFALF